MAKKPTSAPIEIGNLVINKVWISDENAKNPGAITWMRIEIDTQGNVVEQEFLLHLRVDDADYATSKAWLVATGRLK